MKAITSAAARRWGIHAAFALALLASLELTARVWLFGLAGLDPRRVDSVHSIGRSGFLMPSPILGLTYELRPNMDGWLKLARFHTNSRGMCDREIPFEKPEGEFRVAVIGDSYAMPSGVELADSFHGRLEARYNAGSPPRTVEFANFAVAGYLPHEFLASLRYKALDYGPDLVLVGATDRSARLFTSRRPAGSYLYRPRETTHPFFSSFLLSLMRARSRSDEILAAERRPAHPSAPQFDQAIQENVVEAMGRLSRERGVPIAIVRLATVDRPESPADEDLRRQAEANGLAYLDTRSGFAGTDDRDFWIHALDRHPNAAAHARFADVIGRFLAAEAWLEPSAAAASAEGTDAGTH